MKIINPVIKAKQTLLKRNKIIIFIEKIIRYSNDNKENAIYLLVDFPIKNSNINLFFERIQLDYIEGKSMLEIKNIKFDEEGVIPREGHYYYLPDRLIEGFGWVEYNQNNSDISSFIALSSDGIVDKIRFEKSLNYKQFVEEEKSNPDLPQALETINNIDSTQIEVNVYNVGQGNWNEICFNESFLITYDLGATSSSDFLNAYRRVIRTQTRRLKINTLLNRDFDFKKILIISHWDIDHYTGIFDIDDDIVESYDFCLVPNKIENQTTRRALDKLQRNTDVYPIEMSNKGTGRGATSILRAIYDTNILKIYKGTKCSDRNKRGLSISLHAKNKDFIFPADHHYNQINDYIIPNCTNNNLSIVTPHHGGHAGNYNLVNRWNFCTNSVISANGKYGHPYSHIVTIFNTNFALVHRTDVSSDYCRLL